MINIQAVIIGEDIVQLKPDETVKDVVEKFVNDRIKNTAHNQKIDYVIDDWEIRMYDKHGPLPSIPIRKVSLLVGVFDRYDKEVEVSTDVVLVMPCNTCTAELLFK
jgi:hypothetical protein